MSKFKERNNFTEINMRSSIDYFIRRIREYAPKDAVSFTLRFSFDEIKYGYKCRTPEYLKDTGISMKNLNGEWITNEELSS